MPANFSMNAAIAKKLSGLKVVTAVYIVHTAQFPARLFRMKKIAVNKPVLNLIQTKTNNGDFFSLSALLDKELWQRYPEHHETYKKHSDASRADTVIVGYLSSTAVACGCFIEHPLKVIEIKCMFVHPDFRRQGFAGIILAELENRARKRGYETSILETGLKQPEAIKLHRQYGYEKTADYMAYQDLPDSICFKKSLV